MRILVEPSDYRLLNRGDAASLWAALDRLRTLWPEAVIEVLTDDRDSVLAIAPSVTTRSTVGHAAWNWPVVVAGVVPRRLLGAPDAVPTSADAEIRARWPRLAERPARRRHRRQHAAVEMEEYLAAVADADLVVVTGMAGITDEFGSYAMGVLGTLSLAARHGIPAVMMSQQIGPAVSGRLRRVARRVLPQVEMIALRESRRSMPVVEELGVDPRNVRATGDDTIATVHAMSSCMPGQGIGLNLRAAPYSGLDRATAAQVGEVVRAASCRFGAPVVGLPVSENEEEDDASVISEIARPHDQRPYPAVTDLRGFVALVQECRMVVTGSYHAAVFAVAQGIPAVCVTNSPYYDQKFAGLRDLFGEGCQVVNLGDRWPKHLETAIERAWARAPEVRAPLLAAAARQVEAGRAAYSELPGLVERGRTARSQGSLPS
jgi:polysaccharide pyruvyl transferase WcaK-like protein